MAWLDLCRRTTEQRVEQVFSEASFYPREPLVVVVQVMEKNLNLSFLLSWWAGKTSVSFRLLAFDVGSLQTESWRHLGWEQLSEFTALKWQESGRRVARDRQWAWEISPVALESQEVSSQGTKRDRDEGCWWFLTEMILRIQA